MRSSSEQDSIFSQNIADSSYNIPDLLHGPPYSMLNLYFYDMLYLKFEVVQLRGTFERYYIIKYRH